MSTKTSYLRFETFAASRSRSFDLAGRVGMVLAASAFIAVYAHERTCFAKLQRVGPCTFFDISNPYV